VGSWERAGNLVEKGRGEEKERTSLGVFGESGRWGGKKLEKRGDLGKYLGKLSRLYVVEKEETQGEGNTAGAFHS